MSADLAAQARERWGLPWCPDLASVRRLLTERFAARPYALSSVRHSELGAEGLNAPDLVVEVLAVEGEEVRALTTDVELAHLLPEDEDERELEESCRQWSAESVELAREEQRLQLGHLAIVVLERSRDDELALGNFRVIGPGQRLREQLWAATGIAPKDSGPIDGDLYRLAWATQHARPAPHPDPQS